MNRLILTSILLVLICSCIKQQIRLEEALTQAGDNRVELEAVLEHYSKEPADSLKYRAAIFLVENMPRHFSWGGSAVDNYKKVVDSLYPEAPYFIKQYAYGIPSRDILGNHEGELIPIYDITTLDSDYLIKSIDNAFDKWQQCFWLSNIAFDDFCEYILPYRLEEEPLLPIDSIKPMWRDVVDMIGKHEMMPNRLDIRDIMTFRWYRPIGIFNEYTRKFAHTPNGCVENALAYAHYIRIFSMATYDYVPCWANHHHFHYWGIDLTAVNRRPEKPDQVFWTAGKVFRRTYSHNPIPQYNGVDYIPNFFRNPFNKDITERYLEVADVNINLSRDAKRAENIYLSVFNTQSWNPTAWTKARGSKALFRNVSKGVAYMPIFFKGKDIYYEGYPFILDMDGRKNILEPDKTKLDTMRFYRKFPHTTDKYLRTARNISFIKLEASNDINFRNPQLIHEFRGYNPHMGFVEKELECDEKYRYWRLYKNGQSFELGEIEFVDSLGNIIKGRSIHSDHEKPPTNHDKIHYDQYDKLFDGDVLTYAKNGKWVGLDMGQKQKVNKIRVICRTDANYINPGDTYELFYWSEKGWESLGQKIATEDNVFYDNIPHNALLWFRNITQGTEERILTIKNGRIRWW